MESTVMIYGASGGIGEAVARSLHDEGYQLVLAGRNHERLEALSEEFNSSFISGDIRDDDFFDRVGERLPDTLQGLVYAVGTINLGSLNRLKKDDFINDYTINALGAALAVKSSLSRLKKSSSRASVVLISSVAATRGFSMHASMGMAKGAINGLTLALAAELSPHIRVNAVAPSITQTPLTEKLLSNEKVSAAITSQHPLKRFGTPEDISSLINFLISPKSDWISGQIFGIDGGRSTLETK